jgi:hypothetical protein
VEIKDSPQWNRLSFVSCACNRLILMDESLQLLPVVETLDLSRNKFAKVDNLRKCTKLKHLDLGFNHLRSIAPFYEVGSHYTLNTMLRIWLLRNFKMHYIFISKYISSLLIGGFFILVGVVFIVFFF